MVRVRFSVGSRSEVTNSVCVGNNWRAIVAGAREVSYRRVSVG